MPRAVVTGGSGKAGEFICCELLANGWQVVNADVAAPGSRTHYDGSTIAPRHAGRTEFIQVDITDMGQLVSATSGADAIIHMAAYPSPGPPPEHAVFETNVMAVWNVLEVRPAAVGRNSCRILACT